MAETNTMQDLVFSFMDLVNIRYRPDRENAWRIQIPEKERTFFNGFSSASHAPVACGSSRVASIRASVVPSAPSRRRRPLSRAGMTLVSFRTSLSPGRRNSGSDKLVASVMRSGVATSRRDDETELLRHCR